MISWLQITAGQGRDECTWVVTNVLETMRQEAHKAGHKIDLLEAVPGDQPNALKSVLLALEGKATEEFIASWEGTIQWVGASMFRPHHKRKNWYVGVKAFKSPEKNTWQANDLRIERMRSSGPGGQHANKTESAIRVTHLPTGISAVAQEERSQHLNRKLALSRLADRLEQAGEDAWQEQQKERWVSHITLGRGNPIRVYEGEAFKRRRSHGGRNEG